jgi:hypothetical protein
VIPSNPSGVPPETAEVKKRFFITHVGWVTVNNYGAVEWDTVGNPIYGYVPKTILAADTLFSLTREVRASIAEMRKEAVYAR